MKLVFAIVSNDDATTVMRELNKEGFQVTKLASTGGFLRVGNVTLLVGTDEEKVEKAPVVEPVIEDIPAKVETAVHTESKFDNLKFGDNYDVE